MSIVNSKTEVYAILGDPICHSLSPVIMNSSFKSLEMNKVFLGFRCNKNEIETVMNALKVIDLKGYVFTMPLKEVALDYIDELTDEAKIIGAINCVKNSNGYLTGYNTDSIGFWTAIHEKNFSHKKLNKLFIFGMGGFSKAAVTQAALQGVEDIVVTNKSEETEFVNNFNRFKDRLHKKVPQLKVKLLPWEPDLWKADLENADIVVNATPDGLNSNGDLHLQIPYKNVKKDAIFFDAIYQPIKTKFLEVSEEFGHQTINGLDLLAHQGVCSFEIWTGHKIEPRVMKENALKFLYEMS